MKTAELIKREIQAVRVKTFEKKNLTETNKQKIIALRDKYKGERCFIIGGSPSLKKLDLSKLNDEYTFTVNRGYKLKEQGLQKTTFHVIIDLHLFLHDKIEKEIPDDWLDTLILHAGLLSPLPQKTLYIKETSKVVDPTCSFESDMTKPIVSRKTVIFSVIQIAQYLGFEKIYFIGIDADYTNCSGHVYEETLGEKKRELLMSVKNQQDMLDSIKYAADCLSEKSISLYNASPVGKLDCIPRVEYDTLFDINKDKYI